MQPNVRAVGGAFWDFVDHTLPLTEKGMAEAMRLAGLESSSAAPVPPLHDEEPPAAMAAPGAAYLRLRPAQWLLGGQMLLVAKRPKS